MAVSFTHLDRRKPSWISRWLQLFLLAACLAVPAQAVEKTAADYFIKSLPGQPEGPLLKMHAGHIEVVPEHNGHLFFWLFHNRHIGDRQRTVIWLNGGPGCSSMDGALMEVGPYRVEKGGKLKYNEGSWDEFTNLLFVDNPVGTGFSYVNTDSFTHELQEMADQFIVFMEKFFTLFPEYENDDLYFAGESYAGQHIPYIAKAIVDRNTKAARYGRQHWNLEGLLIGNGWIAPVEQYQAYLPFAYENGLLQGGTSEAEEVEKQHSSCMTDLSKPGAKDKVDVMSCEAILQKVLAITMKDNKCTNMYDVRLTDSWPACGMNWPPDLDDVTPYLRDAEVTKALHINPDKRTGWKECTGAVSSAFRASNSKPSVTLLPGLLESGVRILLFSGDKDYICNHIGTEALIDNLKWSGGTGFELSPGVIAPRKDWEFEGTNTGYYQEARNLTYVLIHNSSHMVPFDLPRVTRDMLDRFIGVDIASVGGKPVDSEIDGEKAGPETSVGGHPNSTTALDQEAEKLKDAEYKAYYRSGEAALVVVLLASIVFGWWVWRGRRRARARGYMSVPLGNDANGKRDIEGAFTDDNELDNLENSTSGAGSQRREMDADHYDLASDSDDEDHAGKADAQGKGAR